LEETCKWNTGHKIRKNSKNVPIINRKLGVKLPQDRKEWLMDYIKCQTKKQKNQSAEINRDDCIIIKFTPPKFGSQKHFNSKLNFQNLLHEGFKNNLKACEKI